LRDAEVQGIMPRPRSDSSAHLHANAANSDSPSLPETSKSASVVVVLASKGYPENPSARELIALRPLANSNIVIFHAGTARNPNGQLVTEGGRVLNVPATGPG